MTLAPIEVEAALQYLTPKIHFVTLTSGPSGAKVLTGVGILVALALMVLFTVINIAGVRWLSDSNVVTVVWKIAIPVLTVVALMVAAFHGGNFSSSAAGGFAPHGMHGILAALPAGVVFSLTGFEQAVQLGGESRNPARDLPRAVLGALGIGLVLYVMLQVAFVGSVSPHDILHGWANPLGKGGKGAFGPFATLATTVGLGWLAVLLYIDAVISPSGTGLIYIGTSSRVGWSLSRSGYTPKALLPIDKRGVPIRSILLSFVIGLLVFLPFRGLAVARHIHQQRVGAALLLRAALACGAAPLRPRRRAALPPSRCRHPVAARVRRCRPHRLLGRLDGVLEGHRRAGHRGAARRRHPAQGTAHHLGRGEPAGPALAWRRYLLGLGVLTYPRPVHRRATRRSRSAGTSRWSRSSPSASTPSPSAPACPHDLVRDILEDERKASEEL